MSRRPPQRRLGRPPASDSSQTRERILKTARLTFSQHGYGATTNKYLAEQADVTTGALYHYFESKLDIYAAVLDEVQAVVYQRFEEATAGATTFLGALEAVLDASHELNTNDPSLALFLGAARVDVQRYPELAAVYDPSSHLRRRFFDAIIDIGIRTGEIDVADRKRMEALIRAIMVGLVDAVSDDVDVHRAAIEGVKSLLEGKLVRHVI